MTAADKLDLEWTAEQIAAESSARATVSAIMANDPIGARHLYDESVRAGLILPGVDLP